MNQKKLDKILKRHKKWLENKRGGRKADLRHTDLRNADLRHADLSFSNLCNADMRGACLQGGIFHCADLSFAYLRNANAVHADFSSANLYGADLQNADLRIANFSHADLQSTDLYGAKTEFGIFQRTCLQWAKNVPDLPYTNILPDTGSFIGWKKAAGKIIKLEILEDAKRCNAPGRKCRCDAAKVLEIQNVDGTKAYFDTVTDAEYGQVLSYKVGETISVADFDDNWWNERGHGIHFFITRQECILP